MTRRRSEDETSGRRSHPAGRRAVVAAALARLAPRLPAFEAETTLDRALDSPGLRGAVPETVAWLALVAYARHAFTEYDALLDEGYDRDSARHFVLDDLNRVLADWGVRRQVSGQQVSGEPVSGEPVSAEADEDPGE